MENTAEFQFNGTVLAKYTGTGGDVVIPDGVTAIGKNAFSGCTGMTSVTIPDSVTSIGESAFEGCTDLTSIALPDSITFVHGAAFYGCTGLTDLTIPNSVTFIGSSAFRNCKSLTSVIIPDSVTSIGAGAFSGCIGLSAISISKQLLKKRNDPSVSYGMVIRDGAYCSFYGYAAKTCDNSITTFILPEKWNAYDLELINNGPMYKYKAPARLLGCLGRLVDPVDLTDECRELHMEYLIKNAKKLIPLAEELCCPAIVEAMRDHGIINDKNKKAIAKLLTASTVPEIAGIAL